MSLIRRVAYSSVIVLWLMVVSSETSPCSPGQFSFGTDSLCSTANCPGPCIDAYTCCADECFTINTLSSVSSCDMDSGNTNDTDETKCRSFYISTKRDKVYPVPTVSSTNGTNVPVDDVPSCRCREKKFIRCIVPKNTLHEIACIANLSGSTFEICLHQVATLLESGTASLGNVDPFNCPCESGFTKVDGSCPAECGDDVTRCYNTSDLLTNQTACCINNTILPTDEDCESGEYRVRSVVSLNFVACTLNCIDTCRLSQSDRLPACCRLKQGPIVNTKEDGGLSGGVIALIVILVVGFVIALLAITIFVVRRQKQKDTI